MTADPSRDSEPFYQGPARVTIHLPGHPGESPEPAPPSHPQANDEADDEPTHSRFFETVRWRGVLYPLTTAQRAVVAALWQAWQEGHPFVSAEALRDAAGCETKRVSELFRGSDAWGTVVVSGVGRGGPAGSYVLAWAVG